VGVVERSTFVGREAELRAGGEVLARQAGVPRTLLIHGEAGMGKTRLITELLAAHSDAGAVILAGRSVAGSSMPMRPVVEIVSAALKRLDARAQDPRLDRYRPVLAHLSPAAAADAGPELTLPALAESVLFLGSRLRAVFVLDDLHWADADTVALTSYLADRAADEDIVLIAAARDDDESAGLSVARELSTRGVARLIRLGPLTDSARRSLARSRLGLAEADALPQGLADLLATRSDGLPLLVEGLTDQVATGDGAGVPMTFADVVRDRLSALDEPTVDVIRCAAVFGQSFPHELLGEVTGRPADVLPALRAARDCGLVVIAAAGGFEFGHALTAQAVAETMLPPERASLCGRAAGAVLAAHPDPSRPWRVLAAHLLANAGDAVGAARLLQEEGADALAAGSLTAAVELLGRSADLAADAATRLALLRACVVAGDVRRADAVARDLLADEHRPQDAAAVELLLARAHQGADPELATAHVRRARAAAADDEAATAEVDAVEAVLTLESSGSDRITVAEELARRAVDAAERLGLPDVECEAWGVVGRCLRLRDLDAAESAFARQLRAAEAHGLTLPRIHALNELGTIDALRHLDDRRLQQAFDAAEQAGALTLVATYCVNLVVINLFRGRHARARELAERCETSSERQGRTALADTARVWLATCFAYRGQRAEMEAQLARVCDPSALDIETATWGLCRAMCALVEEDRAAALRALETAGEIVRRRSPLMGDVAGGPRLLLQLVDGSAPADAVAPDPSAMQVRWDRMHAAFCAAVVAGKLGRRTEAEAALGVAREAAAVYALHGPLYLRLVAEAAIEDGWGDPVAWLVEAEAAFIAQGLGAPASACRGLLRRCGVRVGRSGADAESQVPEQLRRLGVTARESEVLRLACERLSNREIAERLHLSTRTVEKHVASLLSKLDMSSRKELGAAARLDGWFAPMTSSSADARLSSDGAATASRPRKETTQWT
jgi:DNA-binding CsgD family transcriptional regulator